MKNEFIRQSCHHEYAEDGTVSAEVIQFEVRPVRSFGTGAAEWIGLGLLLLFVTAFLAVHS